MFISLACAFAMCIDVPDVCVYVYVGVCVCMHAGVYESVGVYVYVNVCLCIFVRVCERMEA